ncbi:MAG TPA: aminotransferase class V-fold PLP-dependent enzyme [Candidatus Limnocylindria bacterium]|nr:aminotransferase class V-fold PLP-dependent enzyme [Candidatus Limnocylindria bacterium]
MSGRPFLQIPGPTNVPDRVLRAMDRAVIDHRSPAFAALVRGLLPDLARVFKTERGRVIVYPSSGTGAWEASLVNVLAPGDRVLAFEYGHFSAGFAAAARNLGFAVDLVPLRWGQSVPASAVAEHLRPEHRAVLIVHNETSTGVRSDVRAVRKAIEAKRSDALLIVDTVSSLGSMDFRFDEWGVDVALTGSQKGLMLPPGLGFVCASPRAIEVASHGGSPRNFFDWRPILEDNAAGFFPYTPATLVLFGLREALDMLFAEGLEHVFARHYRLADGVRAAVRAWGLGIVCEEPDAHSDSLTAVVMPEGLDSNALIARARDRFDLALGVGLGTLRGRVFRIGHLGALNELEVLATLGGVEMALRECGHMVAAGAGVGAAEERFLTSEKTVEQAALRA